MTATDLLSELCSLCACGVFVTVNEHRNYRIDAIERLRELDGRECPPECSDDVRAEMIRRNSIIEVQCYARTPIGFYRVVHFDLAAALQLAVEACGAK